MQIMSNRLNITQVQPFKGVHAQTENGTNYYKTNSGLKIGSAIAAIDVASVLFFSPKGIKNNLASIALPIITNLGCGAIVDAVRNKKSAKVAEQIKQNGLNNALIDNEKIMLSRKGNGYYESNTGAKLGGWLGLACGLLQLPLLKQRDFGGTKGETALGIVIGLGLTALGGYLLGKLSDNKANKDARKHA